MIARRAVFTGLLLACGAAGCAASRSGDLARLEARAERAYSAGRYAEAARFWEKAAATASRRTDRDEARYRQAASLVKAGRPGDAEAVLDQLLDDSPRGDRAPRAALDRANLILASGDAKRGREALDLVVRNHPNSGVAAIALRRLVELMEPEGEAAVRAYLDSRIPALEATELGEHLHAAYAASLERSGDVDGARARYLLVADKYPYPHGALWDDALFHAAELAARSGSATGAEVAIQYLERMLAEREPASIQGSYERGRYGEAQYRIAELYRDALHDPARARAAFERLWAAHRTSRLRDEAAWNAAVLALGAGDADGACRDLRALVSEEPLSRYAACAPRLCAAITAPHDAGPCHEYVVRDRSGQPRD